MKKILILCLALVATGCSVQIGQSKKVQGCSVSPSVFNPRTGEFFSDTLWCWTDDGQVWLWDANEPEDKRKWEQIPPVPSDAPPAPQPTPGGQ